MPNLFPGARLETGDVDDPETLAFARDLDHVGCSVHQGGSIYGPWMEERVKDMLRAWLDAGRGAETGMSLGADKASSWQVSGPSQVFDPQQPGLRSRSWDAVVHLPRKAIELGADLPPAASKSAGLPLLPRSGVVVVVDTKTFFADPRSYAAQPAFNLMNDFAEKQLDLLGPEIEKIVLTAASSYLPDTLLEVGREVGLEVFSMGRRWSGPVADGFERSLVWRLERFRDGSHPLQRCREAILAAVANKEGAPRRPERGGIEVSAVRSK